MIRLFLGLIAFLSVSIGGLFHSFSGDSPLDEIAFENDAVVLEADPMPPESAVQGSVPTPDLPSEEVKPTAPAPTPVQVLVEKPVDQPKEEKEEDAGLSIESRILRFGFRTPPAPRSIDTIVLHSSYNALGGDVYSVDKTISEYEQYGVGAHYLIDRSGRVLRLVEEANIAYHAGSSKMPDGRKNVNDFSIGIEIIATEESGYTDKQYAAVNALIADIKGRHKIKSVVGHSDIAPGRKTDPWKFDWKKLE